MNHQEIILEIRNHLKELMDLCVEAISNNGDNIDFDTYINTLPRKVNKGTIRYGIMEALWNKTGMPKHPMSRTELDKVLSGDWTRALRKLRDEDGCDIETIEEPGMTYYCLRSIALNPAKPAITLNQTLTAELFHKHKYRCNMCNTHQEPGRTGLQRDHRKPVSRGGLGTDENFQPLCQRCNAIKRAICSKCTAEECDGCIWFVPENFPLPVRIAYLCGDREQGTLFEGGTE